MFGPWTTQPKTPRELMLQRLRDGVPPELATRAAGLTMESLRDDHEVDMALAEGEILLFERARDSGVTGVVRAAMRREAKSWMPKAEVEIGLRLEDYLKD
jgi:hypothetical protein